MRMFKDEKSLLGYEVGDDGIDSYGVNHNGFSTRDELEYQMARQNREQQLIQNYNNQGITENYPQYTTNFWGNADNNYGFGTSDISGNVQNITNRFDNINGYDNQQNYDTMDYTVNTENLIGKPSSYFQNNTLTQSNNSLQNSAQNNTSSVWDSVKNFTQNAVNAIAPYTPTYYIGYGAGTAQNTFNKLKDLYGAYKQNGATYAAQQYGEPSVRQAIKASEWLTPLDMSDVNKHQYVSCVGSTGGPLATAETLIGGAKKEIDDYKKKMNDSQLFKQYGGKSGILDDIKKIWEMILKELGKDYGLIILKNAKNCCPSNIEERKDIGKLLEPIDIRLFLLYFE